MAFRLLLCLLLAGLVLPVAARQPAMMAANGGGSGCAVEDEAEAEAEPSRAGDKRAVVPAKARPATQRRGSEQDAARTPRWHSFLPGMIR
ncbi:MAG TPA: hypothetical protein PK743_04045 [Luteimonas sp.]|nr:hypothetical protein [Luteimonas sp.]HRO28662.1 hypothetical protein [Luteimonas sp.]HRP71795.1 hypothetical protein [Luteimonas sp.]